MNYFFLSRAGCTLLGLIVLGCVNNVYAERSQSGSLQELLILSLKNHPQLEASRANIRAAEARLVRAGLLPNPNGTIELENFAGSGNNKSFSNSEITVAFSQLIELGNKRKKRSNVADAEVEIASSNYLRTRVLILRDVSIAFIDLLAAQYQLQTDTQIHKSATTLYHSVSANVEAGKAPPVEEVKARVELSRARLAELQTKNAIVSLRDQLSWAMGHQALPVEELRADFFSVTRPQELGEIYATLTRSPDIVRQKARIAQRQHAVTLAKANRIPDLSVSAGIRRFEASDDTAAVASLSIPLFIFDNKKTFSVEAEANLTEELASMRALEFGLKSEIAKSQQIVSANYEEFLVMQNDVVPSAELALERIAEAYRLGKLSLLDLIDSQRTFFEAKRQLVQSAGQYHTASIQLESLIGGTAIPELQIEEEGEQ